MDKKFRETTNLGLEIVRQVKRKLGHVCSRLSIRIGKALSHASADAYLFLQTGQQRDQRSAISYQR